MEILDNVFLHSLMSNVTQETELANPLHLTQYEIYSYASEKEKKRLLENVHILTFCFFQLRRVTEDGLDVSESDILRSKLELHSMSKFQRGIHNTITSVHPVASCGGEHFFFFLFAVFSGLEKGFTSLMWR